MNGFQRIGGLAALIMAATFVVGFVVFIMFLNEPGFESSDPVESVLFLVEHQTILHVWHLIIYVLFGAALVVLSLALHDRLKHGAPALAQSAAAFGLIWAALVIASGMIVVVGVGAVVDLYETDPDQAGAAWVAIESVQFGIGGGIEIVGALWVLLIGWTSVRVGAFSRNLNYLGVFIGVAGTLTLIPALEIFGAVFGLSLIVWFTWIGVFMLRSNSAGAIELDMPARGTYHHIST